MSARGEEGRAVESDSASRERRDTPAPESFRLPERRPNYPPVGPLRAPPDDEQSEREPSGGEPSTRESAARDH